MSDKIRIVKNTGILLGMEMVAKTLGVAISVILARYLTPQGFGLLSFAVGFASLFKILPGFGMGTLAIRDLARDPHLLNDYFWNGQMAKVVLSLGALLLISCILWGMHFPFDRAVIVLLAGGVMSLDAMTRFNGSFFHAAQRMAAVAVINFSADLGWMISALIIVLLKGGVLEILAARLAVSAMTLCLSIWMIHTRLDPLSWRFDPKFVKKMMKSSLPFAVSTLFGSIYGDTDTVMLTMMKGDIATGWYAVAQKFLRPFILIPTSVRQATLPALSKFSRESPAELKESVLHASKYLSLIGFPVAGGIFILAEPLILLVFGRPYLAATPALYILSASLPFMFLDDILWSALTALGRERRVMAFLGFSAFLNLSLNFAAIPFFGPAGASATTLFSCAVLYGLEMKLIRGMIPDLNVFPQIAKPAVATILMMLVTWFLSSRLFLMYTIVISALFYFMLLFLLRVFGPEEWAFLKTLLRRGPRRAK